MQRTWKILIVVAIACFVLSANAPAQKETGPWDAATSVAAPAPMAPVVVAALQGQVPPRKGQPTYAVSCAVARIAFEADAAGRLVLQKSTTLIPELTTLEGSRAEYASERRVGEALYQFKMQVQVQRFSDAKVRLEILVEDVWTDGAIDRPTIHRKTMQCSRLARLNEKLKVILEENNERKGEGITVELNVREAPEEE
jgi:hypothetical protein